MDDKQELMTAVGDLRYNIIEFFKAFNIKVKSNSIDIVFALDLERPYYLPLWGIDGEPSIMKVEFILKKIRPDQTEQLQNILQTLIDKLVRGDFPDTTGTPYEIIDPAINNCTHYNSINFSITNDKANVVLVGAICYCN